MAGLPERCTFYGGQAKERLSGLKRLRKKIWPQLDAATKFPSTAFLGELLTLPVRQLHVVEPGGIGSRAGVRVHLEGHIQFL